MSSSSSSSSSSSADTLATLLLTLDEGKRVNAGLSWAVSQPSHETETRAFRCTNVLFVRVSVACCATPPFARGHGARRTRARACTTARNTPARVHCGAASRRERNTRATAAAPPQRGGRNRRSGPDRPDARAWAHSPRSRPGMQRGQDTRQGQRGAGHAAARSRRTCPAALPHNRPNGRFVEHGQ